MLVRFLCLILLRMSCGRSLSVLRILPTGMCFFPVLYSMLVNVLFASCYTSFYVSFKGTMRVKNDNQQYNCLIVCQV